MGFANPRPENYEILTTNRGIYGHLNPWSPTVQQQHTFQWIGLRENLQESPIFDGKIDGFRLRFSLKPIHFCHHPGPSPSREASWPQHRHGGRRLWIRQSGLDPDWLDHVGSPMGGTMIPGLVICYIAIEHGPVEIVSFPMKKWWFSIVMLVYQRLYHPSWVDILRSSCSIGAQFALRHVAKAIFLFMVKG